MWGCRSEPGPAPQGPRGSAHISFHPSRAVLDFLASGHAQGGREERTFPAHWVGGPSKAGCEVLFQPWRNKGHKKSRTC